MGLEENLPGGVLLTSVEKLAGYARKCSVWPATFGLACCAIELFSAGGPRHDLARFGMERASNTPRQADLMIVAGRVSQKMAPVLRQIYDQMSEPKWVISMGVCASSGGMFNNYAIVQGVDHIVPVDIYLPGCPPRPEMLLFAILKLHDQIQNMKLGVNRDRQITELEQARLRRLPLMRGVSDPIPDQHRPPANLGGRRGLGSMSFTHRRLVSLEHPAGDGWGFAPGEDPAREGSGDGNAENCDGEVQEWHPAQGVKVADVSGGQRKVGAGGSEKRAEKGQPAGGGGGEHAAGLAGGSGGGEGAKVARCLGADKRYGHCEDAEGE